MNTNETYTITLTEDERQIISAALKNLYLEWRFKEGIVSGDVFDTLVATGSRIDELKGY